VLKPLSDLAPDLMHPTEHKSLRELWRDSGLDDTELEEIQL
jgi:7,8-dihydro-6-hydroxymethylpterin-pyrophosphokinase